jgi:hypothetical protein
LLFFFLQTTLYEAGKDALEREFRDLLKNNTTPVSPVVILDVLAEDESEAGEQHTIQQLKGNYNAPDSVFTRAICIMGFHVHTSFLVRMNIRN